MRIDGRTLKAEVYKLISSRPDEALHLAEKALQENPTETVTLLLVAELYSAGLGEGQVAAKHLYERVLSKEPDNAVALTGLALQSGISPTESLTFLLRVADMVKTVPAYMNLGYKQWEAGRYDDAHQTFERIHLLARERRNLGLMRAALEAIQELRLRRPPKTGVYQTNVVDPNAKST
jgi:tetratricopeptide (TPR) repeat protein